MLGEIGRGQTKALGQPAMRLHLPRISLAASIPALVIALIAVAGVRLNLFGLTAGHNLMIPASVLAAIGFVTGTFWIFAALIANDSRGWRLGAASVVGSLLILVPVSSDLIGRLKWPPLVDITTDPGTPPQFVALLPLRAGAENGPDYDGARTMMYEGKETTAIAVQKKAYPDLHPYAGLVPGEEDPMAVIFWRAFEAAKRMGWNIVAFDEESGRIEATDGSFFFGTTDDIAVRVRAAGRMGARVDVRSKSRMGTNDGGKNAARIRAYVQELGGR